jgi:hypothetical protein
MQRPAGKLKMSATTKTAIVDRPSIARELVANAGDPEAVARVRRSLEDIMRKIITSTGFMAFIICGCGGTPSAPAPADVAEEPSPPVDAAPPFDVSDATFDDVGSTPDISPCPAGHTRCGDACIDLQTDATHCGACGGNCRGLPGVNSLAITCERGTCAVHTHCAAGFGDCDTVAMNGCETDLSQSSACGACGINCSGATPTCGVVMGDGGVATRTCTSGCTPMTPSRCGETCVDLQSDPLNCGACGTRCTFPNAMSSCTGGTCSIAMCTPRSANCDRDATNGCETEIANIYNCGACDRACPQPTGPHAVHAALPQVDRSLATLSAGAGTSTATRT